MTPLPRLTSARPASNCGFTSTTMSAPGRARSPASTGATVTSEMKDRSATRTSKGLTPDVVGHQGPDVGPLPHLDPRSRHGATGRAGRDPRPRPRPSRPPRRKRQSVKPPVDAPASRQRRPATSTAKRSSAASSFSPPRDTKRAANRCRARRRGRTRPPGGPLCRPVTRPPGPHACSTRSRALFPGGGQTPPHQLGVEPAAHPRSESGAARLLGRPSCRSSRRCLLAAVLVALVFLAGPSCGALLPGPSSSGLLGRAAWPRSSWRAGVAPTAADAWPGSRPPSWRQIVHVGEAELLSCCRTSPAHRVDERFGAVPAGLHQVLDPVLGPVTLEPPPP